MAKNLPAGFNAAEVIAGLHRAMEFGEPTRTEDRATFYTVTTTAAGGPVDEDGVPFDPTVRPTRSTTSKQVKCAVEFADRADLSETFGIIQPTRVKITLLDAEYQQVKDFAYVVVGGDRYNRRITEPPVALGSIDVWTVHCVAEDES